MLTQHNPVTLFPLLRTEVVGVGGCPHVPLSSMATPLAQATSPSHSSLARLPPPSTPAVQRV